MKSHKTGWSKESRINFFSSDLNNRAQVFSLLRLQKIAVNTYRYLWKSCLLSSSPAFSRFGYPNEKEKQARRWVQWLKLTKSQSVCYLVTNTIL